MNIDNNFFDNTVNRIYPSELQLNKENVSYTEASFLDLHLSISNGFVNTKICDKRDDFDFVNFPFLDGDVPRSTSYGVSMVSIWCLYVYMAFTDVSVNGLCNVYVNLMYSSSL